MASHVAKHTAFAHGVAGAAGGAGFGRARRGGLHAAIGGGRDLSLDGDHTLPSGRAAELCDILPETQPFTSATWLVVRMVVPELPETGSESAHNDHDWVCAEIALPVADPPPARIVVQLMAEPFIRGEPAPGITQSIEAYMIRDGVCIWELL